MKKYIELTALLCSSLAGIAQNHLPAAYQIKTDTIKGRIEFPDSCWEFLPDKDSKLTIDQASSFPIADRFLKPFRENIAFDNSINTYWLRYRLKNDMNQDVGVCIPASFELDEIFTLDAGKWQDQVSGKYQPWSKRDGFKSALGFPLMIKKGRESLIYERLTSTHHFDKPDTLHAGFRFKQDVLDQEYYNEEGHANFISNSMYFSLVLGVLLFAALLNLFFFLIVRERVYLYFALFVVGVGLMRDSGFLVIGFFRDRPWLGFYFTSIGVILLFFSLIQFARSYLNTAKHFPLWDKILVGLNVYISLLALIGLFIWPSLNQRQAQIWNQLQDWSFSSVPVIILITFFFYMRRSENTVRLVTIAALPLLVFWLSTMASVIYSSLGITAPYLLQWSFKWLAQVEQLCCLVCDFVFMDIAFALYKAQKRSCTTVTGEGKVGKRKRNRTKPINRTTKSST